MSADLDMELTFEKSGDKFTIRVGDAEYRLVTALPQRAVSFRQAGTGTVPDRLSTNEAAVPFGLPLSFLQRSSCAS